MPSSAEHEKRARDLRDCAWTAFPADPLEKLLPVYLPSIGIDACPICPWSKVNIGHLAARIPSLQLPSSAEADDFLRRALNMMMSVNISCRENGQSMNPTDMMESIITTVSATMPQLSSQALASRDEGLHLGHLAMRQAA
jgi:hypothetical protein